jgi:hypothetical protein
MRSLVAVIDRIVDVVPSYEQSFLADLDSIRSSAMFSSPETMSLHWMRLGESAYLYCNGNLTDKMDPWQIQVRDIVMDRQ